MLFSGHLFIVKMPSLWQLGKALSEIQVIVSKD